jgi:hypothetical protein
VSSPALLPQAETSNTSAAMRTSVTGSLDMGAPSEGGTILVQILRDCAIG